MSVTEENRFATLAKLVAAKYSAPEPPGVAVAPW